MLTAKELATGRRLIEASQRDPRRFDKLYDRYFERVYAFALARTRNRAMAEDVTAETFRQAFQNLSQFQWRGVPFSSWLFRIASNAAADLHARGARQTDFATLPQDPADPSNDLADVEARVQFSELVRRLPGDQRRVIVLRFAQEQRIKEIAETMGRSEGAVKQLQLRALQQLRAWVGESYD